MARCHCCPSCHDFSKSTGTVSPWARKETCWGLEGKRKWMVIYFCKLCCSIVNCSIVSRTEQGMRNKRSVWQPMWEKSRWSWHSNIRNCWRQIGVTVKIQGNELQNLLHTQLEDEKQTILVCHYSAFLKTLKQKLHVVLWVNFRIYYLVQICNRGLYIYQYQNWHDFCLSALFVSEVPKLLSSICALTVLTLVGFWSVLRLQCQWQRRSRETRWPVRSVPPGHHRRWWCIQTTSSTGRRCWQVHLQKLTGKRNMFDKYIWTWFSIAC